MATVDRTVEAERFLQHLNRQTYRDFELIVVDQNNDDRLLSILSVFNDIINIEHIKSNQRGASRARNLGIKSARGEIIGFPDDDCWYPPDLLHRIAAFFDDHPQWDGLSGRIAGLDGRSVGLRFHRRSGVITRCNAWRRVNTSALFLRRSIVKNSPGFDEQLGVGAGTPWGAAEEVDYMITLADNGVRVYFDPGIVVYHPDPFKCEKGKLIQRGFSYGCGMGKVMRKNNFPLYFWLYYLLRSAGGILLSLIRRDWAQAAHYKYALQGRWYGWRKG
jgi:glycosyltransferase involved in cell wall biosynthesis